MPTKPLQPCRAPGCAALVASGYCDAHRKHDPRAAYDATKRKTDAALAIAASVRNRAQWQKVRTLHRAQNPLCCDPFGAHNGWPTPAAHSHHIKPLATHPELAHDLGNLAALCVKCHAKVEAMERAGKATQHLFNANGDCGQS